MVVTLGSQTKATTADAGGRWSVRVDALPAGGPLQLQAKGKKNAVTVTDVLVGEVWLCSGQSNMTMTVAEAANKDAEIAAARHPQIRMYQTDYLPAKQPQARCNGHWIVCSPQTVAGFSATAYFFGRELHKQLHVPIGLIHSSWGVTPIQTWISTRSQLAVPELKPGIDDLRRQEEFFWSGKAQAKYDKQLAEWEKAAAAAKANGKPFQGTKPEPPQDPALRPWAAAASTTA